MRKEILAVPGAIIAMVFGLSTAMAEPGRFIDLDAPHSVAAVGADVRLQLYPGAADSGIRLHNAGKTKITLQDTVSLVTLRLEPGMRIGLACESMRHFAVSVGEDVVYESVACGSLLRFSINAEDRS